MYSRLQRSRQAMCHVARHVPPAVLTPQDLHQSDVDEAIRLMYESKRSLFDEAEATHRSHDPVSFIYEIVKVDAFSAPHICHLMACWAALLALPGCGLAWRCGRVQRRQETGGAARQVQCERRSVCQQ